MALLTLLVYATIICGIILFLRKADKGDSQLSSEDKSVDYELFDDQSFHGAVGEWQINRVLSQLDGTKYSVLHNLLLPSRSQIGTAQIDHLVVSNYGIFCIETKANKGWVFGNVKSKYWKQVLYYDHYLFYNPILQNYSHTKAIKSLLSQQSLYCPIYSLIVFTRCTKLKVYGAHNVFMCDDLLNKITSFTREVITDDQRQYLHEVLSVANITDKEAHVTHVSSIHKMKDSFGVSNYLQ